MREEPVDYYVLHAFTERQRHMYTNFREAFKAFTKACKCRGSAAMWRGPKWERLFVHGAYPEQLSEPYESYSFLDPRGDGLENYPGNSLDDEESLAYFDRYIAGDR